MLAFHEEHMRADRRAHRKKQREQHQRVAGGFAGRVQISVEEGVCRRPLVEMDQIHQRKRQIIEDVSRGNNRVEFDGIEHDRLAVDEDDVAEMEIAVATPYAACGRPCLEEGGLLDQCRMVKSVEPVDRCARQSVHRAKLCRIPVDDPPDRVQPWAAWRGGGSVMGATDRVRQCDGEGRLHF